ncbi:hypothetical protein JX265_011134 [Neoarthrinium moseri]|uniref:NADPH-dependent diflavin oxidoreductase 1 n=1 Tax=Neoarthrinium moseri TaxID=1658444 RepID=A0A9P9WCZ2_9PEZI|nr:hypothetical protein JX265_011134 [Neoarthrinium moseri]
MAEETPDNAGDVEAVNKRRVLILYGSETGNSLDSAVDLEDITERLHFKTDVLQMNDVGLRALTEYPLVIFVISTTGQGELPKNARIFWKRLLSRKLRPTIFNGVKFTTFGLGDSSYSKYNWAARKLHKRLEQLGAVEFYARGEADERHEDGIDGAFLPWSISLRSHLLSEFPLPEGLEPIPSDIQLPPKVLLELDSIMEKMGEDTKDKGEPILDSKAAWFSHVDAVDAAAHEQILREDRLSPTSQIPFARLSDRAAASIFRGIDYLDRLNTLKDDPVKYSLEESKSCVTQLPPEDLLPIPHSWTATVESNDRVTPENHWQDVRRIRMRVHEKFPGAGQSPESGSHKASNGKPLLGVSLYYDPGDAIKLYPKNFPEDVQALIDRMGWNDVADERFRHFTKRDDGIAIEHAPRDCHPLQNSTLRQLLTNNYDITAIPKRSFFSYVKFFTDDPMHKERLSEFADPRFTDEFYDYTTRPRRSILEILQEFSTVRIPYQYVASIFPIIRPREYSVASSAALPDDGENPNDVMVELLIAVVKYKTVLRKTRRGLCSRYIESLMPDSKIRIVHVEHSAGLQDKELVRRPFLGIGAGTGVAPLRAFFWDRSFTESHGPHVLIFGARNREADFFFKDEWESYDVKVLTAFSRDQREKVYVQDVIRREHRLVCALIQQHAIISVCGGAGKMPVAVREAILDAMVMGGLVKNEQEARNYIEYNNDYWEEVW